MTEDARVCLETCTPRREAAAMEWILLADVEFAESQHGYYFVDKKIDHLAVGRWFADYEERNNSPESGESKPFGLGQLSSSRCGTEHWPRSRFRRRAFRKLRGYAFLLLIRCCQ